MSAPKVSFFVSFIRSQIAAFAATMGDFSSLYCLTESQFFQKIFSTTDAQSLLIATAIASIIGACISFKLGRTWAFKSNDKNIWIQACKYATASFIIACINVIGMHFLSNVMGNSYMLSKAIIAVLTGVFVSFPLFRYWVFR